MASGHRGGGSARHGIFRKNPNYGKDPRTGAFLCQLDAVDINLFLIFASDIHIV